MPAMGGRLWGGLYGAGKAKSLQMQLNLKTDYSLRLLLFLAVYPDEVVSVGRVAKVFGISANHLIKVAQILAGLELLELVRGRNGGMRLAVAPGSILLGEVVRKIEGSLALVECFDSARNTCVIAPVCGLKGILQEAQNAFFSVLGKYSLADVLNSRGPLKALLVRHELTLGASTGGKVTRSKAG